MDKTISRLTPLYDVKLIINNKHHFYEIARDPVWKPGVTEPLRMIAKDAILPWALNMMGSNIKDVLTNRKEGPFTAEEIDNLIKDGKNIYKKKSESAANLGTRAHLAVDSIIHGISIIPDDDIKPCVDAFIDWKSRQTLTFELGDTKIGSRVFGYGGSLDFIGFDGNKAFLFDLKTSKAVYPEYSYQLAAYCQGFKETYGVEISDAFILRVGKDKPDFEVKRLANMKDAFDGFLAALKLYNLSKVEMFDE